MYGVSSSRGFARAMRSSSCVRGDASIVPMAEKAHPAKALSRLPLHSGNRDKKITRSNAGRGARRKG